MDEKLLELDALSLTKYWLMSNAKLREEIDHDTTQDVFYIKQSDASGFCAVKAFEYKEKVEEKAIPARYVTKGRI